MIKFTPLELMKKRLESSKEDSDLAYFYDLLLFGEFATKIISLFLVAAINDDVERTRYRQEKNLVKANAIGDFSKSIGEILTGPPAQLLPDSIRDYELKELTQRSSKGSWQYESQKLLHSVLNAFNIKKDNLGTKSALKNWFGTFSYLRNKTKGHGATTITPCSKACPNLEKSIFLILENLTLFKRSWAYLHRNYSGKYRISPLTETNNQFDFLKKEKHHSYTDGIYCYLDKPLKINLFISTPELVDFFITNGNLKNDTFEYISYISDERRIESARDFMGPVTDLPSSHTEGKNELDIIGNCFTNIPSPVKDYINRGTLEEELNKVLCDTERFPVITLLGRGGIGKTSLALNVVNQLTNTTRFNLIIWFSARDIDLLMEGPKQVQTKVLNEKDISKEYHNLVCPKENIKDQVSFFAKQLTKNDNGDTLYIFDNFETITNPVEVFEWINNYIRNPNKVLITSRMSRNFKADYPIEVSGMNDYECRNLITKTASKLNIIDLLTDSYIEELITESNGHPYIIKILLGEVSKKNRISKIRRIVAEKDEILTALFKRTFNTLSPAAKRVFLTLCSWNSIVPRIAIEAILWRPENERFDIDSAIEELQKSSFIEIINEREDEEEQIITPLAAAIFGKSELEVYPEKIKINDDKKMLMEFGASNQRSISIGVSDKIERKFSSVAKRVKSIKEFEKELPILEYIASKFPKSYSYIIDIFEEYEDYTKVKYYLREYLKTAMLPNKEKANAWFKLANICKFTEDWDGESHALSELILLPDIEFNYISEASNRINNYFSYHPQARSIDYKKALLDKIIEVMKKRIEEGNATDYSRLAWLFFNNNRKEDAKLYVKKGLEIDPTNEHCKKLHFRFPSE